MRISIFPTAKPHPKGKEEKVNEAFKFSYPHKPQVVSIANDEELVKYVTSYSWSPFIFKEYRRESDFISTDFLVFDIDEGLTIAECEKIIRKAKLCCLCLPSPSHTPENERFRIILPLARAITNLDIYAETWRNGAALFGVVDEQCKDSCRGYFGSTTDDGFWIEGNLFTPVIPAPVVVDYSQQRSHMVQVTADLEETVIQVYGEKRDKIPEAVEFFIKNAHTALPGKWMNSLNACAFSLALSEVDEDVILQFFEQLAPNKLDSNDLYQIKRSIKDGKREASR